MREAEAEAEAEAEERKDTEDAVVYTAAEGIRLCFGESNERAATTATGSGEGEGETGR